MGNPKQLKFKYNLFGFTCVMIAICLTAYPASEIGEFLADFWNIPENVPVKEQKNGWLWVFAFLAESIIIFLSFYAFVGWFFAKIRGWSREKYINVFFKCKYPEYWYK